VVEWLLEAFRLAFRDSAEIDDELLFDALFALSDAVRAALEASVSVWAALVVALLADALPEEVVVLLALPLLEEVLPPLDPLLVNVELPVDEALPPVRDVAVFDV
jgi:hypothetical protein